jgi:sugar-specific transcriptional regulator TrmB
MIILFTFFPELIILLPTTVGNIGSKNQESKMKQLIKALQDVNFTLYEARTYLALLQHPETTGYEIAKNSGIPASKIYQVLNKLLQKEVVAALDSEPVRYTPIPPQEIFSQMRTAYNTVLDTLQNGLSKIYHAKKQHDYYIWNLGGRQAIMNRIIEFIDKAQQHIYLSIWDEEVEALEKTLLAAEKREVELTIVHYGQRFLNVGSEYRHGREHTIRQQRGARRIALEVDGQYVLLGHFLENGGSNAAWTTNAGLVLLARDYIIHDIYTIKIAEKFGDAVNEIFESH